jgi:hypothetical protein
MSLKEAQAWLRGERSHINTMLSLSENRVEALALIEVADSASTQRAYWIARSHKEGLVLTESEDE